MGFLLSEEKLDKELKLLEDGEDLAIFYEDYNIKPGEEDQTLEFIEEEANTPEDIDAFLKDAEFDSNEVWMCQLIIKTPALDWIGFTNTVTLEIK